MTLHSAMRACIALALLGGSADAVAGPEGRQVVQARILDLIRDTALKSDYAASQVQRLTKLHDGMESAILLHASGEFRRMGLSVRLEQVPGTQEATLTADWSGRAAPDELILLAGHLDHEPRGSASPAHAQTVAAALGVAQVFNSLRLKPRRTVRILTWAGAEHGYWGASGYARKYSGRLDRHVAVIESGPGGNRPDVLSARMPQSAVALLEPLKLVLRPLGIAIESSDGDAVGRTILPLEELGVPGFAAGHEAADDSGLVKVASGTPQALKQRVAMLATLAWLLGETQEPLPHLPPKFAAAR